MHTVELLEEALTVARQLGYQVRLEAVDGHAGCCTIGGKKLLLVDLADGPAERLDTVIDALRTEAPRIAAMAVSPLLGKMIGLRKAG